MLSAVRLFLSHQTLALKGINIHVAMLILKATNFEFYPKKCCIRKKRDAVAVAYPLNQQHKVNRFVSVCKFVWLEFCTHVSILIILLLLLHRQLCLYNSTAYRQLRLNNASHHYTCGRYSQKNDRFLISKHSISVFDYRFNF